MDKIVSWSCWVDRNRRATLTIRVTADLLVLKQYSAHVSHADMVPSIR